MPVAFPFLIVGGTLLLTAGILAIARYFDKEGMSAMNSNMERLAHSYGMDFQPGEVKLFSRKFPSFAGDLRTKFIRVDFPYETRGGGNNSRTDYYNRVSVDCPGMKDLKFEITEEDFFGRMAESLGWEDAKIGDEQFDGNFRLTGKDKEILKFLLGPEERELINALRKLSVRMPKIRLKNGVLTIKEWRKKRFYPNESALRAAIELASRISSKMEDIAWTESGAETFWEVNPDSNPQATQ